jgi:hypothetical protein
LPDPLFCCQRALVTSKETLRNKEKEGVKKMGKFLRNDADFIKTDNRIDD